MKILRHTKVELSSSRAARAWMVLALLLANGAAASAQSGYGPQGVVRRFCDLDGRGQRVATQTWPALAGVVEWPLEPVWDHAVLIAAYQVGPPLAYDSESLVVEVLYSVVGQITANGQGDQAYLETIRLRIRPDDAGNWRIMGPPPAPHLFASGVDIAAARRAVQPGQSRYPTNSDFVWQMFRFTGWNVEYETTADLLSGRTFRRVGQGKPGDLIVYSRDGTPYHVGILDDETHVTSATINAGIMHTPIEMFAGDVTFLRLIAPLPEATEAPAEVEATPTPSPRPPAATKTATPKPPPKRTATVQKRKPTPIKAVAAKSRPAVKPSAAKKKRTVPVQQRKAAIRKPTPRNPGPR